MGKIINLMLLFLLAGFTGIFAQNTYTSGVQKIAYANDLDDSLAYTDVYSPFSYHTEIGTSFAFFPGLGSVTNFYASPSLRYKLSPRINLQTGISAINGIPAGLSIASDQIPGASISMLSAYFSGSYLLNDHLVIHGTGTKGFTVLPWTGKNEVLEINDFSIGATYDFGNFSIGASFHRSNAPFYRTPYGFGQPFYGF